MSSVQHLREFIRERLTAAAQEIFTEVEKTIICYEEELDAQRRMMGIDWKPQIKLHRVGSELQRQSSGRSGFVIISAGNLGYNVTEQLSLHVSPVVESKDQEGSSCSVSESQSDTGTKKRSFKCDICGRCYTQRWKLKNHYRTHTGEKPFSCETCGKSFSVSYVLNRHKTVHSGERPFSCQLCGKGFSQKGNLMDHKRTHTGEKPFSCQSCGKSFCQKSLLNRHKTIHTGEKPFSCESCGKSFCQISILNRHKTIHTSEKPFPCQTCGRRFNRRDNLSMHMKTHTGRGQI
ncbi:gastrula zinc finger protein XlCGF7.1-like [Poecilia latipinna]|uniref:gastrula zinc finger protein XlCGF7.1-like n=1 Tax=Poecilia latipinna TaxID=48699 RepID=UPI00072DDB7E|nr:PREDICTED: gastrula zinc finger protein XlCGF7.1-like [Poecilia latipinna]